LNSFLGKTRPKLSCLYHFVAAGDLPTALVVQQKERRPERNEGNDDAYADAGASEKAGAASVATADNDVGRDGDQKFKKTSRQHAAVKSHAQSFGAPASRCKDQDC